MTQTNYYPVMSIYIHRRCFSFSGKKYILYMCGGIFLCFAGLPPAVQLLYWAGLPPVILDPSVLSKGVKTSPTGTQIGSACAQIMPRLLGACLRQAELF